MFIIENDVLKISFAAKGAELQSILHKKNGLEYLWDANPAAWAKHSPVLFPIVGTLKNNTYFFKEKSYTLSRHGFARDMEFNVQEQTQASIVFFIESNETTKAVYPFEFRFYLRYEIVHDELIATYGVMNNDDDEIYFSVGAHPAFKLPLFEGTAYNDYYLEFNKSETAGRWPISKEGLIENQPITLLQDTNILPLSKELFAKDALVLKGLSSDLVTLKSDKVSNGIEFSFVGFPYLGLWAAPGADFLCIEPWCGIADSVDADQQLVNKEGIIRLSKNQLFEVSWKARFY
jgi:galactose mutarotase-like enzyme